MKLDIGIRRVALVFVLLMGILGSAEARSKLQGYAFKANGEFASAGRAIDINPSEVYARCAVSVFEAGTTTLAPIFADTRGTTKPNPFPADENGYWWFYADTGRYDVEFSGAGIKTPFRLKEPVFATASLPGSPGCGVTVLPACGTNEDEPAWANFGATATIVQGADSTSASPTSDTYPAFSFQTWRNGSGTYIGYPFAVYRSSPGDDYGLFSFLRYSADMDGFNQTAWQHAMRAYLTMEPTNVTDQAVVGYGLWAQGERLVGGNVRAVGAQIDANNSSSSDAEFSNFNSYNTTFAIATNAGAGKHNSAIIYSQAENSTAYSVGWKFTPNSIFRYGLDFTEATFQVQGTVAVTNGSTTVTGTGTSFQAEIVKGDQLLFYGTNPYTVASVDLTLQQLTLTTAYGETNASGLTLNKYVIPIRMGAQSFITARNLNLNADFRLAGLAYVPNYGDQWSVDPDAKGVAFGGSVILRSLSQSNLGTPPNGTLVYCTNCNQNSTCTSGGSGALAKRIAGAWQCN